MDLKDIIKTSEQSTKDWSALRATDVMTSNVLTVFHDWTILQLSRFLIDNAISGAPVIDNKKHFIGVVTLSDIVRQTGSDSYDFSHRGGGFYSDMPGRKLSNEELTIFENAVDETVSVVDIMTPLVYSVWPDTPLIEICDAMVRGHIHRVLVTKDNALVGVISVLDVLRAILGYSISAKNI